MPGAPGTCITKNPSGKCQELGGAVSRIVVGGEKTGGVQKRGVFVSHLLSGRDGKRPLRPSRKLAICRALALSKGDLKAEPPPS